MISETRCMDDCGTPPVVNPELCGWRHLELSGRWRCPACALELDLLNQRATDYTRSALQEYEDE